MLPSEFKNLFHHETSARIFHVSTIFRIFICLLSQIVIVLIGIHHGNCLSNFVKNTHKMSWMPKRKLTSLQKLL